ncbi:pyridoxal phosphate-dependent aminotransferase [Rhodohalobacter sp. SW132]|uniref:pyridoxal phosphate-dependent aminotransferase n=1 Tax=Rhodohalobacter sp. SW132 TaxID=2293433 RepID=UPI000E2490E2|nr:pyridoxal phosphate-dependent aminotransferase [Rhodohalobacter sp. SW132]REL38814.1 pyridoxal phosphate-dependent aminotransferase [Rhodohalobacter sp. SW132]
MRNSLLPSGLPEINYGIRQIVGKGFEREKLGYPVIWENIGDPVQKGMRLPDWMKDIITEVIQDNSTFGYCDSKGLPDTREYLAQRTNDFGGCQISADDITFFNGLGDAIARLYSLLSDDARVLLPSPAYPAHTGAEKLRIRKQPLTYTLDPSSGWLPQPDEIRKTVEENPDVSAILIVNPDNPTGVVYSKNVLLELVQIAREYELFIIADEIYENLVYDGKMVRLSEVIGDVPGIAMKGISKEIPWPGSRCGWLEYYNRKSDHEFSEFCDRIDQCKMTEVCSTTLPQKVIPGIMSNPAYSAFLDSRISSLAKKMSMLKERINVLENVECKGGQGAFYAAIHFNSELHKSDMKPELLGDVERSLYLKWTDNLEANPDLFLTYYLLAGTGVCTVPLSGFNTPVAGLRLTLLEQDMVQFEHMLDQLEKGLESVFSNNQKMVQV